MKRHCPTPERRRNGFTVVELIATASVFAALALLTLPMLQMSARQQREAARQQLALLELGNIMERIAASAAAGELTPEMVQAQQLSASAADQLPGAELKVNFEPASAEQSAARITLEIAWTNGEKRSRPVQLRAWFSAGRPTP